MTATTGSPGASSEESVPPDHDNTMFNNAAQSQYNPQSRAQASQLYLPSAYPPLHARPPQYYAPQPQLPEQQHSFPPTPTSPIQPPSTSGKRKRKSNVSPVEPRAPSTDFDGPTGPSPSGDSPETASSPGAATNAKDPNKRTKTQRACDPCRRKKIRCDVLANSTPPICAHCRQYGFDCTFFLPITETRFKKRKTEEEENKPPKNNEPGPSHITSNGTHKEKDNTTYPRPEPTGRSAPKQPPDSPVDEAGSSSTTKPDVKIYGPTSLSYILHASDLMPGLHNFDLRYHHAWKASRSGHGFLTIVEQEAFQDRDEPSRDVKSETVEREVLERLVNYYFRSIAPILPVVTEAEFLHGTGGNPSSDMSYRPAPVLLYAICTLAATARDVPSHIFESLRMKLNAVIRSDDVLSNATLVNIQALLIASMTAEPHGRVLSHGMSAGWLRAGTAIRMAQDLGLHRAEAVQTDIQLRRRLWSACVITDRWYGLIFGLPLMIDVHDCDARLPGPELVVGHPPLSASEAEYATSLAFMGEFVKLSVILGKVTKTIYSPTGLIHTTDEVLERLLEELDRFVANLPPILRFTGRDSSLFAGLLQLYYVCVCMMFWRVFARIQYTVPSHLKFSLTVERWTDLTDRSASVIEWLDEHETIYDSWFLVAYAVTACALIQYHTWARRKDTDAQDALRRLRDCVRRWDRSVESGHMNSRRKTTEIISLLYEATLSPVPRNFWPLNPTPGVETRNNPDVDAIQFRKDPTRPGGGLFVATQRSAAALGAENIPRGTLVLADGSGASEAGSTTGGSSDSGHERKGEGKANVGAGMLYGGMPYQSNPVSTPSSSSPTQPSQPPVVGQHLGLLRRMEPPPAVGTLSTSQTSGPSPRGMSGGHGGGTSMSANMTGLDMGMGMMGTMPNLYGGMTTPANVNPNLNAEALSAFMGNGGEMPRGVQVLNILDGPQPSNPAQMQQYAAVNNGLLDGIPATMFEWEQWDSFFSRFQLPVDTSVLSAPVAGGNAGRNAIEYGYAGGVGPLSYG